MTVSELIARLQAFPADTRVVLALESGHVDVLELFEEPGESCRARPPSGKLAPHLDAHEGHDNSALFEATEIVVVISTHEPAQKRDCVLSPNLLAGIDALDGPDRVALSIDDPEVQELYRQARAKRPWLYKHAIFLDADRVLRAFAGQGDQQDLAAVLQDFPHATVVITGERTAATVDKALAHLPRGLAGRIEGVIVETDNGAVVDRYHRILGYLDTHPVAHWVALDTNGTSFPASCPQLILCGNGFDGVASMELRARLTDTA